MGTTQGEIEQFLVASKRADGAHTLPRKKKGSFFVANTRTEITVKQLHALLAEMISSCTNSPHLLI
jgi:hypothetical protein